MPNPFYEGEEGPFVETICVNPTEAAEALSYVHPVWGPDCILGTPDDDENDVGQDECATGFLWDETICACVSKHSWIPLVPAFPSTCSTGYKCL